MENMNICKPNFSQNITITRTGEVTLKLTDSIILPPGFEKLVKVNDIAIYENLKFKIGQNKL
jgi:hypothetical protein